MVKKKKKVGKTENKLAIITVTVAVVSMALILGVRVSSIKQELARREAYNENIVKDLAEEESRANTLEERRKYVQTDSYIIEMAREKLGLVFPDEIAIKAEK